MAEPAATAADCTAACLNAGSSAKPTHASWQAESCYDSVALPQVLSQMLEAETEPQPPASDLADSPVLVNSPQQSTLSPFASDGAQRGVVLSGSDDDECSTVSRADDNRWAAASEPIWYAASHPIWYDCACSVDRTQSTFPLSSPCRHVVVCSPTGLGCSGRLQLDMQLAGGQAPARLSAQLMMEPLQLQLHPHHLPLLGQLQQSLAPAVAGAGSGGATAAPAAAPADDSWLGDQVKAILSRVELSSEGQWA